jgi:hypothetical protein
MVTSMSFLYRFCVDHHSEAAYLRRRVPVGA